MLQHLCNLLEFQMKNRINNEASAKRGTILNGRFHSGNKSYPVKHAVEINPSNRKAWAVPDKNGNAVVVGQ